MPLLADELASYVEAVRPIIYIPHFDHEMVHSIIREAMAQTPAYVYTGASAYKTVGGSREQISPRTLDTFLDYVNDESVRECCIILQDVHRLLVEPSVIAQLKSLAGKTMYAVGCRATVFILSAQLVMPPELEPLITVVQVPHPDVDQIATIVKGFAAQQGAVVTPDTVNRLAVSFKGLHEFDIKQILALAYQESGTIGERGQELILREKEQIIRKSGMVEIVSVPETMDDVGGLDRLKEFLQAKAEIFHNLDQALAFGVDIPKGILIVGMPGCGKSLSAKTTAQLFRVPLIRLDVGKCLGKYVGESEDNMRRALKVTEAVSPCVLWVDEIEKAFSGLGGSSGGSDVTTRLFGYFLTWLQEKQSSIYVVATANSVNHLPPEFLRRGRFDELFFVNFPTADERRQIFDIHLKKRNRWHTGIDHVALLKQTQDFTGADIEAVVRQAIENAFLERQAQLTTEDLLKVIRETKSLKETLKEQIADMEKDMARYQFKPASAGGSNGAGVSSGPHWSVPQAHASRSTASNKTKPFLQGLLTLLDQVATAKADAR